MNDSKPKRSARPNNRKPGNDQSSRGRSVHPERVRRERPSAGRFGRASEQNSNQTRPDPTEERTSHIYRARSKNPGQGRAKFLREEEIEDTCRIKERCGGCEFVNTPYETSLAAKHQRGVDILGEAGIKDGFQLAAPVGSPKDIRYRSLFKLAVRPGRGKTFADDNRYAIGLFKPGTHNIVEVDHCPLHTYPLKGLIADLRDELEALHLTPYNEADNTGDIRYLVARSAHITGEIMLTIVVTSNLRKEMKLLLTNLKNREHHINSCHMNINSEVGNNIFGDETIRIGGANHLRERLCDLSFEVAPTSFFQINPWQAVNLYRRVENIAGSAKQDAVAWDLYCGSGQMALLLARSGYKVLGIEENPDSIENAKSNARKNGLENVEFIASRVEDSHSSLPEWSQTPDVIVVNPSRRGLAKDTRDFLKEFLAKNKKTRLIYVSCEMDTLARDLKDLSESGKQLKQLESFDMFPQTNKMEWLAVLS
jgi:23S rRNA (uracil1939-C5)-methyltransferase